MPEETNGKNETRRPILTRKEQTLLAFILALLLAGGIVQKVRMDWSANHPAPVSSDLKHGQN